MSYQLDITQQALDDIAWHKKSGNKAVLTKLQTLFIELLEHPFTGTGKPEQLKYELAGLWSRRINKEHRLIYDIQQKTIIVLSAKGHYEQ